MLAVRKVLLDRGGRSVVERSERGLMVELVRRMGYSTKARSKAHI